MAYLHCHNCYWSQDDFWDLAYNPISFIEQNYTKELLEKPLDEVLSFERHFDDGSWYLEKMTRREHIARVLEQHARTIREMEYRTFKEFKAADDPKCPGCGEKAWDID